MEGTSPAILRGRFVRHAVFGTRPAAGWVRLYWRIEEDGIPERSIALDVQPAPRCLVCHGRGQFDAQTFCACVQNRAAAAAGESSMRRIERPAGQSRTEARTAVRRADKAARRTRTS